MTQVNDLVEFDETWYAGATEEERATFRNWLLGVLKITESVEVTFKKADGELREMKCTLKEGICPTIENPKLSDTLCTVWALDVNAWRSFKFENIKKINFML
jgi:predicted DNA-binding transcriptional regulator YafY